MGDEWFYRTGEQEIGPLSGEQMQNLQDAGLIAPDTPVRASKRGFDAPLGRKAEADAPLGRKAEADAPLGRKAEALEGDAHANANGQVEATAIIVDAPASGSMALADLLQAVNRIGGRLSNSNGKINIDVPSRSVPPELAAALAQHGEALRALLPCKAMPKPGPSVEAKDEEMSVDDFLAELRAVGNAVAQVDPCPELDRLFKA